MNQAYFIAQHVEKEFAKDVLRVKEIDPQEINLFR
jgi:hypothetical protein